MNSVKLTSEASSADQEAAEEFKQYLLSDIQEKGMWKSRFLVLLKLAYFTHPFILCGVISPLISSSYWAPTDLGSSSFSVLSF